MNLEKIMKERPILMSVDNVKAILEGRKTQTRRVLKPQPRRHWDRFCLDITWGFRVYTLQELSLLCPYGQVGDKLWVRETWATEHRLDTLTVSELGHASEIPLFYKADSPIQTILVIGKWRPSVFMPRWASRITLEITAIRVERLQEITRNDIKAEGLGMPTLPNSHLPYLEFRDLWDSINALLGYGWETNPWVWVIVFVKC